MALSRLLVAAAAAGALADGSSGYQQYMQGADTGNKRMHAFAGGADDYQQYMRSAPMTGLVATPGNAVELPASKESSQPSSQSQGGNYQQYMQGAGDYTQYMQGAGDYKQYMQGAGTGGKQAQAGDFQQYVKGSGDYQQYMQGMGGATKPTNLLASKKSDKESKESSSQSQGGNYQQYMKQYAGAAGDYKQYMQGSSSGGSQGGDYKQYMDYQKYMKGQGGASTNMASKNMSQDDAMKQFASQFASDFMPMDNKKNMTEDQAMKQYLKKYASDFSQGVKNTSDAQEWGNKFMDQYASAYKHYSDKQNTSGEDSQQAPDNAKDCKTLKELEAWKEAKKSSLEQYVPKAFQEGAKKSLKAEFETNKERIHNATVAAKAAEHAKEEKEAKAQADKKGPAAAVANTTEVSAAEPAVEPQPAVVAPQAVNASATTLAAQPPSAVPLVAVFLAAIAGLSAVILKFRSSEPPADYIILEGEP